MKNKKMLVALVLVLVLLIGGASVLYSRLGQNMDTEQMVVHEAPQTAEASDSQDAAEDSAQQQRGAELADDFTVFDREGSEVKLSQFFGKPIVLNFWASWCGPCQGEMPDFNEKYLELGDQVHFLMVNMTDGSRETVESASNFVDGKGYGFPIYFDSNGDGFTTYEVYALPTTFFIDADGQVIAQATGAIDGETLQEGIDLIMN